MNEFDCLFACLIPILHVIVYPDCVQSSEKVDSITDKLLDDRTELLVALTAGRHTVDLVIMAELVGEVPLLSQECTIDGFSLLCS